MEGNNNIRFRRAPSFSYFYGSGINAKVSPLPVQSLRSLFFSPDLKTILPGPVNPLGRCGKKSGEFGVLIFKYSHCVEPSSFAMEGLITITLKIGINLCKA